MKADGWYATQWQCEIAGSSILMFAGNISQESKANALMDGWVSYLITSAAFISPLSQEKQR